MDSNVISLLKGPELYRLLKEATKDRLLHMSFSSEACEKLGMREGEVKEHLALLAKFARSSSEEEFEAWLVEDVGSSHGHKASPPMTSWFVVRQLGRLLNYHWREVWDSRPAKRAS